MNVNGIFQYGLAIRFGTYTVQGFECLITGDTTHSVNFTWDCSLMWNESILCIMWLKEGICIARVFNGTFIPYQSYNGGFELFKTFGISVHNISRNVSGHYSVVILLNGGHHEYLPCHPIYLPVFPEQRSGFRAEKAPQSAKYQDFSTCDQQRLSKLEIGLIGGFLPLTVIQLDVMLWCIHRTRRRAQEIENLIMTPEQTQIL